jgi:hypothetical protein
MVMISMVRLRLRMAVLAESRLVAARKGCGERWVAQFSGS